MTKGRKDKGDMMAAYLRASRAYAGLDQEEMAEVLGVSSATVSAWERGHTRIPNIARPAVIQGMVNLTDWPRSFIEKGVQDDR